MKKFILVDLENVKRSDFDKFDSDSTVYIFAGESQNRIDYDMVAKAQKFGDRVRWIKIKGTGKNAADFHIAYFMGRLAAEKAEIIVLTRDKGFDPLIRYLAENGIASRRIESENDLEPRKGAKPAKPAVAARPAVAPRPESGLLDLGLADQDRARRPKTLKALKGYIQSRRKGLSEAGVQQEIEKLKNAGVIRESQNRIEYP